jgi:hypothetical protein
MATFFRSDGWVKNVMGQAIAGASIFVCTQPADASFLPPIPLATVFSDPAGAFPITQPIITDSFGHYDFYAASGIPYSVVVVNQGKVQQSYADQVPMGATLGAPSGSVTNTSGPLTLGQLLLGNGGSDIKTGPVFPGDATKFLNGTGTFSTPTGGAVVNSSGLGYFIGPGCLPGLNNTNTTTGFIVGSINEVRVFQFILLFTATVGRIRWCTGVTAVGSDDSFGIYDL